jgi:tetratricopeptide (TPR) repeat protein
MVHGPFPHLLLAMAHRRAGRTDAALRSYATAVAVYDWSQARVVGPDDWIYHALRREAEPLVMPNLAALLDGKDNPRSQNERMALAAVCQSMKRTAMADKLYGELNEPRDNDDRFAMIVLSKSMNRILKAAAMYADALETDPELVKQVGSTHRYNAACLAARVSCAEGKDAIELNEKERARWREQARVWLLAELSARRTFLAGAPTAHTAALPGQLEVWLSNSAFAGVRDESSLRRLSPAERDAWLALWRDVKSMLAEAKLANLTDPLERGRIYAARRDWASATDCYASALKRGPTDDGHFWFEYAALLLLSGDRTGYAHACTHLVDRCGKSGGPRTYHAVRACTLTHEAIGDLALVSRLAEKELRDNARQYWSLTEQGALAYRTGRFQDAVPLFERALDADAKPGVAVSNWLWLALANQRIGKTDDARRWLVKAQGWLDQYSDGMPARAEQELGLHLHNWLEAQILRREAESLITPAGPPRRNGESPVRVDPDK